MEFKSCSHCGKEIEGPGILFRGQSFCGDECCDEFEEELSNKGIPSLVDLDENEDDSELEGDDDLGYREDSDPDDSVDDDDFAINENDF